MNGYEVVLSRRSVRRYKDEKVSEELMEKLLRAGMCAPSAHNEQPWHFIVISDRGILDEIPKIHPYAKMLNEASIAICVCADHNLEKDPSADYWVQDCSASTENILIAAHSLGLGACWLGVHPRAERKQAIGKLLKLPDNIMAFSIIAIGYPAEEKEPAQRFKPERIHNNCW